MKGWKETMKRKSIIKTFGILLMVCGIAMFGLGLGAHFGYFESIIPSPQPKVYDWSEMSQDLNQNTENGANGEENESTSDEGVSNDTSNDAETTESDSNVEADDVVEEDSANE